MTGFPIKTDIQEGNRRAAFGPAIVALVAFLAVVVTLDPSETCGYSATGPGITIDESFNVQMGVYLTESAKVYGAGLLSVESMREIFNNPGYNPDHPPLGRLWLGIWHSIAQSIAPANVDGPFVTPSARWGSAAAFALTIFLVGWFFNRHYQEEVGGMAGVVASMSIFLMPRLFAHAHLAALETITNLTWIAALVAVLRWSRNANMQSSPTDNPVWQVSNWSAMFAGVFLGLALLTKMQGIVLIPLIGCWAIWHWRLRAIWPLAIWLATGLAVFCVGWPYLWFDFLARFWEYFARSTDRVVLNVWYFGEKLTDRQVPWDYPWVMFLSTIPIGLLFFGMFGIFQKRRSLISDPRLSLMLGAILAPLVLFSLPGVAVYDGARLFLISFPAFAIFVAIGFREFVQRISAKIPNAAGFAMAIVIAQAFGLYSMHPFQLSYYNALVGGASGAHAIGLETTYWSDSINSELLSKIPSIVDKAEGKAADVEILIAPQLHQFQIGVVQHESPVLRNRRVVNSDPTRVPASETQRILLLFHRIADAPTYRALTEPRDGMACWELVDTVSRQGVVVASIWRTRDRNE